VVDPDGRCDDGTASARPERNQRSTLGRSKFWCDGLPSGTARVRLNPASEEALTMYCATGVRDATDIEGALKACSRAASMADNLFPVNLSGLLTSEWQHSGVAGDPSRSPLGPR
jgi:hypothetical protein